MIWNVECKMQYLNVSLLILQISSFYSRRLTRNGLRRNMLVKCCIYLKGDAHKVVLQNRTPGSPFYLFRSMIENLSCTAYLRVCNQSIVYTTEASLYFQDIWPEYIKFDTAKPRFYVYEQYSIFSLFSNHKCDFWKLQNQNCRFATFSPWSMLKFEETHEMWLFKTSKSN